MKDTEFISQMANIASLEQMQQFTKASSFADSQKTWLHKLIWDEWCRFQNKDPKFPAWSSQSIEDGTISVIVSGKNYDPKASPCQFA